MAIDADTLQKVLELDSVPPDSEEDKLLAAVLKSLRVGDPIRDSVVEFISDRVALKESSEFVFENYLSEGDLRYIVVAATDALAEKDGTRPRPSDQWSYYPNRVRNVLREHHSKQSVIGRCSLRWILGYLSHLSLDLNKRRSHEYAFDESNLTEFDKFASDKHWAFAFDLILNSLGQLEDCQSAHYVQRQFREVMRSLDERPWEEYPKSLQQLIAEFGTKPPLEDVANARIEWWRAVGSMGLLNAFLPEVPHLCASSVKKLRIAGDKWKPLLSDWQYSSLIQQFDELRLIENELAFEAGCYALEKEFDPENAAIASSFLEVHSLASGYVTIDFGSRVRMWAALRRFARLNENSWSHKSELGGLSHLVEKLAFENHQIWIDALPLALLHESDLEPMVGKITVAIHHLDPEAVVDQLSNCLASEQPELRDRARGLLAKCSGGALTAGDQARDFISYGVRLLDGTPAFPNPLDVKSGIWIGSLAIEQILAEGVEQASMTFAGKFRDSARVEEEQHTQRLLTDLEYSFKKANLRVEALGTDSLPKGAIRCEQRSVPKKEEAIYGCDVVILVNGSVRDSVAFTACELVQVKKPERKQGTNEYRDAWKIDTGQLSDVIGYSQSATYWLIGTAGEVFACPAKVLLAFATGQGKEEQDSFTINYSDVRSASIPLKQFIVQLVLGLWLGTTDERTLTFARGEEFGVVPQRVFEITVHAGGDNG